MGTIRIPTYQEALDYIYSFIDYERTRPDRYAPEHFDLARTQRLLALLGDPHRRFPSLHIAGTKGKGSTAAMMASILSAAGYKTGLYTSPHLHTFRERIRIGDKMVSEDEVVKLVERLKPLVQRIEDITTFEIITALAFLHFAKEGVELAVLEVGLGGRLDATNVVQPLVAVITSLSYDHTHILGDTLTEIAGEKAGIIKGGALVVSAPQPAEAMRVIEEVCREKKVRLFVVGRDWMWEPGEASLEGQSFKVQGSRFKVQGLDLWIPLLGRHQLINATTAIAVIDLLRQHDIVVPEEGIERGLRQVRWPARLEVLSREPLLVVDGAHNPDSAQKLVVALRDYFTYDRLILIFGASEDKDIVGMLEELLPSSQVVILTQAQHPRAAKPEMLRAKLPPRHPEVTLSSNVTEALRHALASAKEGDLICATGSLFVAAGVRQVWAEMRGEEMPERDPDRR